MPQNINQPTEALVWRAVHSSHVAAVGYQGGRLHVRWQDGSVTTYFGVPAATAGEVMTAHSVGEALHAHVRRGYESITSSPGCQTASLNIEWSEEKI